MAHHLLEQDAVRIYITAPPSGNLLFTLVDSDGREAGSGEISDWEAMLAGVIRMYPKNRGIYINLPRVCDTCNEESCRCGGQISGGICDHRWEEQSGEPAIDVCFNCGETRQ